MPPTFAYVTGEGGWIDVVVVGLLLSALAIFALASLAGFYTGWRVGWEVAAGRSAWTFLFRCGILGIVFRAIGRWVPALRA
jgi:hypothetical protein